MGLYAFCTALPLTSTACRSIGCCPAKPEFSVRKPCNPRVRMCARGGDGWHSGADITHSVGDVSVQSEGEPERSSGHVGEQDAENCGAVGDNKRVDTLGEGQDSAKDGDPTSESFYIPKSYVGDSVEERSAGENIDGTKPEQSSELKPTEAGVSDTNLSGSALELMRACYRGSEEEIIAALNRDALATCSDLNSRTPLHFTAANGLSALCRRLVEAGAASNAQDLLGYTPLHMAVGYEHVETVKELLVLGADANKCTFNNRLPVEIAETALDCSLEQRIIGSVDNDEVLQRRQLVVEILDDATEEEDVDGNNEDSYSLTSEPGTSVVVRKVASVGEVARDSLSVADSDVKVTIRVKGKPMES